MLTDEQLHKIKMAFCSHITMSTYYSSTYKSVNTEPPIFMYTITPRDVYGPDELSEEEWENRPKRASRRFSCAGKEYARIETLNKHVPLKLIADENANHN